MKTTPETTRAMLSRKEVCDKFRRKPVTIWRWERAGLLTPVYIRGKLHYNADEVERLANEGDGVKPHAPTRPAAGAAA